MRRWRNTECRRLTWPSTASPPAPARGTPRRSPCCWLALRFLLSRVKIRVAPPHACGHDASREASRIPPEAIYPALVNLCTGNKPGSATCPLPELALSLCRALRQSLGRNGRINKERPSC